MKQSLTSSLTLNTIWAGSIVSQSPVTTQNLSRRSIVELKWDFYKSQSHVKHTVHRMQRGRRTPLVEVEFLEEVDVPLASCCARLIFCTPFGPFLQEKPSFAECENRHKSSSSTYEYLYPFDRPANRYLRESIVLLIKVYRGRQARQSFHQPADDADDLFRSLLQLPPPTSTFDEVRQRDGKGFIVAFYVNIQVVWFRPVTRGLLISNSILLEQ